MSSPSNILFCCTKSTECWRRHALCGTTSQSTLLISLSILWRTRVVCDSGTGLVTVSLSPTEPLPENARSAIFVSCGFDPAHCFLNNVIGMDDHRSCFFHCLPCYPRVRINLKVFGQRWTRKRLLISIQAPLAYEVYLCRWYLDATVPRTQGPVPWYPWNQVFWYRVLKYPRSGGR